MINPLILNSKFRVSNLKSVAILFLLLIFSIASTEVIWRVVTPSGHSGLTVKVTMPELTDDESCLASAALLALPDQRLPEI
ncbi:MAG: hypothetical protein ABIK93_09925, partial [candidate division WOR-3 bacterium]